MKTQKKILLALIVGLQLLTLPAFAKNTVLIDRTTQSAAEQLDIQIPADVPPGHHEVQIEVSDDAGIVSAQTIYFCKTDKGIIKWDDLCPGELAPYDPSKDPKVFHQQLLLSELRNQTSLTFVQIAKQDAREDRLLQERENEILSCG